jgi:hypothetical protein
MDYHMEAMQKLCRVCGQRCVKQPLAKYNHGIVKTNHEDKLQQHFSITVRNDVDTVHPLHLCLCCVAAFSRPATTARTIVEWKPHRTVDCTACCKIQSTVQGGRRPKPAKIAAAKRKKREEEKQQMERERDEQKREIDEVEAACLTIIQFQQQDLNNTVSTPGPTSKKMKQAATCIIKGMMQTGTGTIELPTGGQVIIISKQVTQQAIDFRKSIF